LKDEKLIKKSHFELYRFEVGSFFETQCMWFKWWSGMWLA